jgi:aspartyl-tRNA(Asn)/glutamyl-tRNA(Gln) amidotransferase subunit C
MATITKDELLKIAQLSCVKLADNEIDLFNGHIQKVISFIDQLQSVVITETVDSIRNVNIMRNDVAHEVDASSLLNLAPQRQNQYFVVPKILDEK